MRAYAFSFLHEHARDYNGIDMSDFRDKRCEDMLDHPGPRAQSIEAFLQLLENDTSLGLHQVLECMPNDLHDFYGDFTEAYGANFGYAEEICRLVNRLDGACLDCVARGSFNHRVGAMCEHGIYCIENTSNLHKPALYDN